MDQEGAEIAKGSYNLAHAIFLLNGDLIRADFLVRESLRIRTRIFGDDHFNVGVTCDLLVKILMAQKKLGDETRKLLEKSLANVIKNHGIDGANTAALHCSVGSYYSQLLRSNFNISWKDREKYVLLWKFHIEESVRICSKIYGPTHFKTVQTASILGTVFNEF
jgi:hypothetical protein